MRPSVRQYATALLELEKEGHTKEVSKRFFTWLSRRGEVGKLPKIVAEAKRMLREASGTTDVIIATATEPGVAVKSMLKSEAESTFTGARVDVRFSVDPNIIGGARLQSDERLYDMSLAAQLRKMKANLLG